MALLPGTPQGAQLVLPPLWLLVGTAEGAGFKTQFLHPGQGGVGVKGGEFFSSQYGKGGREHRLRKWGASG